MAPSVAAADIMADAAVAARIELMETLAARDIPLTPSVAGKPKLN